MMLRIVYNLTYIISALIGLIFFAVFNPRRFAKEFGASWKERLGFYPMPTRVADRPIVIIRCASLGETKIALRLIEGLKENFFVILSVGTRSARDFAVASIIEREATLVVWTPPDFFFFVRKFFDRYRKNLKCVMFVESDLWPEFVWQASATGAKTILVNGRMSSRTARTGRIFRKFFMKILSAIDGFLVRYPSDKAAFEAIGVPLEKIKITGNIKYDFSVNQLVAGSGEGEKISREYFGYSADDFVIVAGSTHRADETTIARALEGLKDERGHEGISNRIKIVIVPRHIERASSETASIFSKFNPVLYSSLKNKPPLTSPNCLIVDSLGLLEKFYSICDAAIIGGSFGARGGQEPMSAAYLGKPVIYGPGMTRFSDETKRLEASCGAIKVRGFEDLKMVIKKLAQPENSSFVASLGDKVRAAAQSDIGAYSKTIQAIKDFNYI